MVAAEGPSWLGTRKLTVAQAAGGRAWNSLGTQSEGRALGVASPCEFSRVWSPGFCDCYGLNVCVPQILMLKPQSRM